MALYPDYATLSEAKVHLRVPDSGDDAAIQSALTAASRAVDSCVGGAAIGGVGRQFGVLAAPEARTYTAFWSDTFGWWVCEIDDTFAAVTAVAADLDQNGTFEFPITDFRRWPFNASQEGRPYTCLVFGYAATATADIGSITATSTWGWPTVPAAVKEATLIQMARFYKRRDAPFGIAGSSMMGGADTRLLARVDPDVAVMLREFRRATID